MGQRARMAVLVLLAALSLGCRSSPSAAVAPTPAADRRLVRVEVDRAKYPDALCNDGSPAVFYLQRGSDSGKWVIFFKGGGDCWSAETCAGRDKTLTSSTAWTERSVTFGGILSDRAADNPDFATWNHVFAVYCSSDAWTGNRPDKDSDTGFYFRGHANADAIVNSLLDAGAIGTPTLRQASHVIISGSSAGGVGARNHLDRLAKALSWADVRGVIDGGTLVFANPAFTQAERDRLGSARWQLWRPVVDESCLASTPAVPWLCLEGEYTLVNHHLATPAFFRQDLYDPVVLERQGLNNRRAQDRPAIDAVAARVAEILRVQPGAFGTAAGQHIALELEQFSQQKVDGLSMAQVLGNWYFGRAGAKTVVAPPRR